MQEGSIGAVVLGVFLVAGVLLAVFAFQSPEPEEEEIFVAPPPVAGCVESRTVLQGKSLPPIALPSRVAPAGSMLYRNEQYRFELLHPADRKVEEYRERGGSVSILLRATEGTHGVQIFVLPYEKSRISTQRLALDAGGPIDTLQSAVVDGRCAIRFYNPHTPIGETVEIWFIKNGYLYEVTTSKEGEKDLEAILETWRFL